MKNKVKKKNDNDQGTIIFKVEVFFAILFFIGAIPYLLKNLGLL